VVVCRVAIDVVTEDAELGQLATKPFIKDLLLNPLPVFKAQAGVEDEADRGVLQIQRLGLQVSGSREACSMKNSPKQSQRSKSRAQGVSKRTR
jgi:hypothetical protein